MRRVHPAGQSAILHGKNFTVGHSMQTMQPNLLVPAMLIGTIDFYRSVPLLLTLALLGSQGQCKTKPLGFIFSHTFHLLKVKFDVMKLFKLYFWSRLLSKILLKQGK